MGYPILLSLCSIGPLQQVFIHDCPVQQLQGRFDASRFGADVVDLASKLVPATLALWNKVAAKMLPTPAKFHYLFNMRELSKVLTKSLITLNSKCV